MNVPYGYVYRITNRVNGKTYIGQRKLSKDASWRQYLGSGAVVRAAQDKYGRHCFTKTLLQYCMTKEILDKAELAHIRKEKARGKGEYNIFQGAFGGDTFTRSPETAKATALRNRSLGLLKRFSRGYQVWNKGLTKETDSRIRAKSERAVRSGVYRETNLNRTHSEETKRKLSKSLKNNSNSQVMSTPAMRKMLSDKNSTLLTKTGETSLQRHDRLLSTDFSKLAHLTREERLKVLGLSNCAYQKFKRRHGMSSKVEPCFMCPDPDQG